MRKQSLSAFVLMWVAALLLLTSQGHASPPPPGTNTITVESAGVVAFKKDFFGNLKITPYTAEPTDVPEGPGHSLVTITSGPGIFNSSWETDDVEFVAFRVHKNPVTPTADAFFPGLMGSRYSKVVRVVDSYNLIVDFEYNGGEPSSPAISLNASGYFFIDCRAALRAMVAAQTVPTVYLFQANETYVTKGMPNINYNNVSGAGDMWWYSDDNNDRANIKISAEDAYDSGITPLAIPKGPFFNLATHDRSIYLDRINILGPTYAPFVVQDQWANSMYAYANGQCERTFEIKNCNTLAEKEATTAYHSVMPPDASWLAPPLSTSIGGGGKRGDRGDGVVDIIGYQRWNLIRTTWVAKTIHSIKNNDGAGNYNFIDGEEVDSNGKPVHMVYEAEFVKRNRFNGVSVSFHDGSSGDARRVARVESDNFSYAMLSNQYWIYGTSNSQTEPTQIEVAGYTLYFGNDGDWRRENGNNDSRYGLINMIEARLFDRIPRVGDTVTVEHVTGSTYRVWGWGLQLGDELTYSGTDYTIATRTRKYTVGTIMGTTHASNYAHYWEITFTSPTGLPTSGSFNTTVKTSATEFLLDGTPRTANMVYNRDLSGHWQYNRAEMNYEYRNILFNGMYRQTSNPHNNGSTYMGLWEFPTKQEWVNCVAMDSDGSTLGIPAKAGGSEAFSTNQVMRLRNEHPDSLTTNHHILVDNSRLEIFRLTANHSPVWLKNRPTLIGNSRIHNPVLLDTLGVFVPANANGMSIGLTDGHTLDLSNSTFGEPGINSYTPLRVWGEGTLILDNVVFHQYTGTEWSGLETTLSAGLPDAGFNMTITGDGGEGSFRLLGTPTTGSITITNWTIRKAYLASKTNIVGISAQWLSWPSLFTNVSFNGLPGDDINP
jgi:hypothetical protein